VIEAIMVAIVEREREGGRKVSIVVIAGWRGTLAKGRE
jgi:hypothetical protein